MDSCSLPGQAKSHALDEYHIEIGMGIHGEPGATKEKWMECSHLVTQLLDSIMVGENINAGQIVVMVNNLGSVTNLELTSIVNDVMNYFTKLKQVKVARLICGQVMTSLDMNGISLTILRLPSDKSLEILS